MLDRLVPTKRGSATYMRTGGAELLNLRSFQYGRTANYRAMATIATAVPRRSFNR